MTVPFSLNNMTIRSLTGLNHKIVGLISELFFSSSCTKNPLEKDGQCHGKKKIRPKNYFDFLTTKLSTQKI